MIQLISRFFLIVGIILTAYFFVILILTSYAKIVQSIQKKTGWIYFWSIIGIILGVCSVIFSLFPFQTINGDSTETFSPPAAYADPVDGLLFNQTLVNNKEVVWEFIVNEGLSYSDFLEKNRDGNTSLCDLQTVYYGSISNPFIMYPYDVDQLYQIIDKYYGTDILPETTMSLDEITENTPSIKDRMNTPPETFKAETYIRAMKCKISPNGDRYYQTARAADDVTKVLINKKEGTLKEILFFSYISVCFYRLSIPCTEKEVSNNLIYYKLAMMYIYLYSYCGYDDQHNQHFLLTAEAYLKLVEENYRIMHPAGNINEDFPDFDYYYASISDIFIQIYGCTSEENRTLCVTHAKNYINYAGPEDKHYDECLKYIDNHSP